MGKIEKGEINKEFNFSKMGKQTHKDFASIKPKAKQSNDCYVYYGQDTGSWLNKNPPSGSSIVQIASSTDKSTLLANNGITGVNSNGSSAKYGNKAYEFFHQPSNIIVEFIIDAINDTLSFGQVYTPPTSYPSSGGSVTAACAKDSNTMLIARSQLAEIIEINLQPGGTYTYNTLFTISNNLSGGTDMVYRPSDNTIFVVVVGSSGEEVHQYSYNGALLGSVSINSLNFPNMMFCHGGKIFIQDLIDLVNDNVYEIGTNPLSLLPSTISYSQPGNAGDAASSPECCDQIPPPPSGCLDPDALNYNPNITHDCNGDFPSALFPLGNTNCCYYPCHKEHGTSISQLTNQTEQQLPPAQQQQPPQQPSQQTPVYTPPSSTNNTQGGGY